VELFTSLLYAEIKSDVILSKIFNFEERRDHIMIGLVENDDFPDVVSFGKDLVEKLFLLPNQVDFRVLRKYHDVMN
jgi:hypothetical protein